MAKNVTRKPIRVGTVVKYVALFILLIIFIGPIIWQISLAFKGRGDNIYAVPPYFWPRDFTWDNFYRVFTDIPILPYLKNSLIVTTVNVCANLITATMAGFALTRVRFPGKRLVTLVIFGCMLIPGETVLVSQFLVIRALGLQNNLFGVILPGLCQAMNIVLMINAFSGIPRELEEAAEVDGANIWRRYWNVCLPQVKGTCAVIAIFTFVAAWNDFMWPIIVLTDESKYTLTVGLNRLRGTFFSDPRLIAAGAVVALIPIVIFYLIFQRYFFQGVEEGGTKG